MQALSSRDVPNLHRVVGGARGEAFTIGGKLHVGDPASVAVQRGGKMDIGALIQPSNFVDLDVLVIGRRDKKRGVWGKKLCLERASHDRLES